MQAALFELTVESAGEPREQADPRWLWKDLHSKLVDGLNFTMPDTSGTQTEYLHAIDEHFAAVVKSPACSLGTAATR